MIWLAALALAGDSEKCAQCHAKIYRSYQATGMAQSSGQPGAGAFTERFDRAEFTSPAGAAQYRVSRQNAVISFDFSEGEIKGRRTLDYFVGSGAVGRSYLSSIDGFLFEAPVSYYSSNARWNLSPGYERTESVNLVREIETGCLNCHATDIQAIPGTVNRYRPRPFLEPGVGCGRCHGAGEEHISRMKTGKLKGGSGIVNPAKLEHAQRDSICAQCHLPGAVVIARPDRDRGYQPGDRLDASTAVYVWEGANGETTVNGHFEQLARSACWRGSAGKLWCGSCHDPHTVVTERDKPAFYRARCQVCHDPPSCLAPRPSRANAQDNCIGCHMTWTPARTVQHAAFTDHSIQRRPRPPTGLTVPKDAALVAFPGFHSTERDLGLAYASVALRDGDRTWGMRAFELLRKVNNESPGDARVSSQLAQLLDRMGREEEACDIYARVVAADPAQTAALVNFGSCLANRGKLDESMRLWKSAFDRRPGLTSAWINLAVAQQRTGDAAGALATLKAGLRYNPVSRRALDLLREMEGH